MTRARLSRAVLAGAALALVAARGAPAQDAADPQAAIPWITADEPDWIDAPSVVESLPPGITALGRTPPNRLPGESTDALQRLIDEARGTGAAGDPPPIRPLE
jgi:hypothetical protein